MCASLRGLKSFRGGRRVGGGAGACWAGRQSWSRGGEPSEHRMRDTQRGQRRGSTSCVTMFSARADFIFSIYDIHIYPAAHLSVCVMCKRVRSAVTGVCIKHKQLTASLFLLLKLNLQRKKKAESRECATASPCQGTGRRTLGWRRRRESGRWSVEVETWRVLAKSKQTKHHHQRCLLVVTSYLFFAFAFCHQSISNSISSTMACTERYQIPSSKGGEGGARPVRRHGDCGPEFYGVPEGCVTSSQSRC